MRRRSNAFVHEQRYFVEHGSHYGCLAFLGDAIMFCLTGGLWLIWVFVREMRRR